MNEISSVFSLEMKHAKVNLMGNSKTRSINNFDSSILNISARELSREKQTDKKNTFSNRESSNSNILNEDELNNFRTILCNDHLNSNCLDPESCFNSHCSAWQRRNPTKYKYSSIICPDIDFSRKGVKGRMSLTCRCRKGRQCEFAHTKEEELYHPENYKTKKCNSFPNCKRYYCPFIHDFSLVQTKKEDCKEGVKIDNVQTISGNGEKNIETEIIDEFELNAWTVPTEKEKNMTHEKKYQIILKLLNCQKLVLEEKYLSAKSVIEDLELLLSSLNDRFLFPGFLQDSDILDSRGIQTNRENDGNNSPCGAFKFFFDFQDMFKSGEKQ
ncbi:ZF-CCCH zinc finger domain-containing protein [Cryptosporidium felis]|nr:ZF-CCCH zinc finger domain-containing protein [Cryptosporidium felis]